MGWKYTEAAVKDIMAGKQPKMSEKVFQGNVRKAALLCGWRYYHPWISVKSTEGYPDCTMVHVKKGRLIFAELKAEGKEPTEKQQEWLDDLRLTSTRWEVYVWHPSDMDEIWEVLRR